MANFIFRSKDMQSFPKASLHQMDRHCGFFRCCVERKQSEIMHAGALAPQYYIWNLIPSYVGQDGSALQYHQFLDRRAEHRVKPHPARSSRPSRWLRINVVETHGADAADRLKWIAWKWHCASPSPTYLDPLQCDSDPLAHANAHRGQGVLLPKSGKFESCGSSYPRAAHAQGVPQGNGATVGIHVA